MPADPSPAAPAFTCRFDAGFDRLEEAHCIRVQGTTDLPDRAVLFVGAYYLRPVSAIFLRPDRPPPPPDEVLLDSAELTLGGGAFDTRLWITRRLPYPGAYRVRAGVYWTEQPAFFRGGNPEDRAPLEWTVEWSRGTEADLAAERESVRREVKADVDAVRKLRQDLAKRFRAALADAGAAGGWKDWLAAWRAPIEPVTKRNADRLECMVLWIETQGKYRIQDLTERVESLAKACTAALEAGSKTVPEDVGRQERDFDAIYDGALNLLGFVKPVDPEVVREHLGPVVADFARLEKAAADVRAEPPKLAAEGIATLQVEVIDRLQTGVAGLLPPVGPEQAVEPATRYTEAVAAFFAHAAAAAQGDRAAAAAAGKALDEARGHLRRLEEMLGGRNDQ